MATPHFFQRLAPESLPSVLLLSILGVIGLSGLMLLPIFVGVFVDYQGLSEMEAGWVGGINLAGIAIMTLIFSFKAKHWSLYKTTLIGLSCMVVFDALSIFSDSLFGLMALRFLSGLGGGAIQAAVAAALARLPNPERGFGIYIGCQFVLPGVAFYLLPSFIADHQLSGLMLLLIFFEIVFLYLCRPIKNYDLAVIGTKDSISEISLIITRPALLSILALCFYGIANAGFYAYVERLGLGEGLDNQQVGDVLGLVNLVSIGGALLVYYMGDRFGHLRPLALGVGVQIMAMLVLLLDVSWAYTLGVLLWSMAWAYSWPFFLSMQTTLDDTGTVVAAGQFSNLVGGALGPVLLGLSLRDGDYSFLILTAALAFVMSFIPMLWVAQKHKSTISSL